MVRKLILLRHGEAEQNRGGKDFDRSLTSHGREQITQLGIQKGVAGFKVDSVICSSSKRTQQTAELFFQSVERPSIEYKDDIYEASPNQLLRILNTTDDSINSLMLIGHNPGLSYLADYLTGEIYTNMSPGDLITLSIEDMDWAEVSGKTARQI